MRSLYTRLVMVFVTITIFLLVCIGIALGQLYPTLFETFTADQKSKFTLYLIVTLGIAFLLVLLIALRVLQSYAKPVDDMTVVASKLAKGESVDWVAHPHLHVHTDQLSVAIKEIAEKMEETAAKRGDEKDRLETLIDSVGSGLIMFGRGGTVRLVNEMFRKLLGYEKGSIIGKPLNTIGLPREIGKLIDDVYLTEKPAEAQLAVNEDFGKMTYSVIGAPVIGNHGNWLGIVVVIHDITELIRLEGVRKDFVANVSHELRTPITSIKGFTETLLSGALEDAEVSRNFLEIIHKESDRLSSLIDDLLVLSGVERAEFKLEYTHVEIDRVIREAIQLVSGRLEEKKMTINYDPREHFYVSGDANRLIQIFVNLLSNAITYSQDEKEIDIKVENQREYLLIIIEDEGIGIESAELPRLFERFYRVDRARSRDSGGTGLGLAIVKHLVEAHEGIVEVYSKAGVGTAFYIKLPINQPGTQTES